MKLNATELRASLATLALVIIAITLVMGVALYGPVSPTGAPLFGGPYSPQRLTNVQISRGLRVLDGGATVVDGGLTVTADGLTVTAGGETITAGNLTVTSGNLSVGGTSTFTGAPTFTANPILPSESITPTDGGTLTPSKAFVTLTPAGAVGVSLGACTTGEATWLYNSVNANVVITDTGNGVLAGNQTLGQYDALGLVCIGSKWVQTSALSAN